jgi:hypothetical protein
MIKNNDELQPRNLFVVLRINQLSISEEFIVLHLCDWQNMFKELLDVMMRFNWMHDDLQQSTMNEKKLHDLVEM